MTNQNLEIDCVESEKLPIKLRKGDEVKSELTGNLDEVTKVCRRAEGMPHGTVILALSRDELYSMPFGGKYKSIRYGKTWYTLHRQYTKPKAQHLAVTGQPMFGDEGKVAE